MKANKVVAVAFGIVITSAGQAGNLGNEASSLITANRFSQVITLSLGPAWSNPGKTQTIYLQPTLPQRYVANSKSAVVGTGELFLGWQRSLRPHLQAQLGPAIEAASSYGLSGDVWQNAEPDFDNFDYSYKIRHAHIAIKGKLLTDINPFVQPYVSGSLGVGFNRAYAFNSIPKLFEVIPEPPFASHTTTTFIYTLGIGLQKSLNAHWAAGVGYEFADWGRSHLLAAPGQTSGGGLSLSHLYTNQLQLSLTFVA